ncbi:hypothetical protein JF66_04710 [Cryobacterium sp. MLB-32]|uniref:SDR family NAD(P)-dependent oxidoreductase n=1 Tax=Cryobacterium sp. MLB-32 TaxID=1529318 RepID=UPI0004E70261|nr:SDR family oxidoreductase [Cryobacterium sp. MLB-32]KFF60402.1 hypothetical protein JF66_04710 [Cryobacterium sp. MLB-32]
MTAIAGSSILIVGATGGLGQELSRALADRGAQLVLSGRTAEALTAIDAPGARLVADITNPAAITALVSEAYAINGRLDGIINAAGVVAFGPAIDVADEVLTELFAVNTLAPIRILRAAAAALAESAAAGRDPFVVTLSGVVSESPTANMAAYSASKAALAAFDQAAARELRRAGIRIIDARPGHTETPLSTHPIAGTAPRMPVGYPPASVVSRIVAAIENGEKDLPSSAFTVVPATGQ